MIQATLLLLYGFAAECTIQFKPILELDPIPEESEEFLRGTGDITVAENGNIYALDLTSRTVFVWNKEGRFLKNFGKQGQGPGEFNFAANAGGLQGYITAVGDKLYIYDGGSRIVSIFNLDGGFESSKTFQLESGRAELFKAIGPDRYLVFFSSYFSDVPYRKVALFKPDGTVIKEMKHAKDNTWRWDSEGSQRRVVLNIFIDAIYVDYDESLEQIIIGDSSQPNFEVFEKNGNSAGKVSMKLVRKEVTPEDIDEFEDQQWFKRQNFFKASYPDLKAYYDRVLPVRNKGYLVYTESPAFRISEGVLVSPNGNRLGKFKVRLGNGGRFFSPKGRLFGVFTDEDGEFAIRELDPLPCTGQGE